MAFTEDLTPFFDTAGFAVSAVFRGTIGVDGLLDLAYFEPFGNTVEGRKPTFICAAADVPGVAHGDSLAAAGRAYKVVGVEPDATERVVTLMLERQ